MILNGGLIRFQDKTHYSIFHCQIYRLDLKAIIFIIYLSKYETSNLYIHTHIEPGTSAMLCRYK